MGSYFSVQVTGSLILAISLNGIGKLIEQKLVFELTLGGSHHSQGLENKQEKMDVTRSWNLRRAAAVEPES